jgi:hypothetical protein
MTTPKTPAPPPTAPAADPTRLRDLRRIHAAARARGLDPATDRSTYEAMLHLVTGQRSARDLDAGQRAAVLRHLAGRGGFETRPYGGSPRGVDAATPLAPWPAVPAPASVSAAQWRYLCYLSRALHLSEAHFAALVKHIVGLDNWRWLDVPTARALITGLLKIQAAPPGRPATPRRGAPRYSPQ